MLKRLALVLLLAIAAPLLTACPGTIPTNGQAADPAQAAIVTTTNAYNGLNAAIASTDAAFMAGAIKGPDAAKALEAFKTSKRGLDAALASLRASAAAAAASAPASGASTK